MKLTKEHKALQNRSSKRDNLRAELKKATTIPQLKKLIEKLIDQ